MALGSVASGGTDMKKPKAITTAAIREKRLSPPPSSPQRVASST